MVDALLLAACFVSPAIVVLVVLCLCCASHQAVARGAVVLRHFFCVGGVFYGFHVCMAGMSWCLVDCVDCRTSKVKTMLLCRVDD